MNVRIYDISPKLNSKTPVFPEDVSFSRHLHRNFDQGKNHSLSSIETTLHIGAHVDAPSHFHPKGKSVEKLSLEPFLGSCQVIRFSSKIKGKIRPEHMEDKNLKAVRLLFATESFCSSDSWEEDFNSFSVELIKHLAKKKVVTLGIDTPSVDEGSSEELEVHHEMHDHGIMILEGLSLSHVPEGLYHLIALPLSIQSGEASPVRAILLPFESTRRIFSPPTSSKE